MKILHVDPETSFGGGERQVLGLIRHLARRGHENVLAAAPASPLVSMLPAADARLHALAIRNDLDLLAALRLRRLVALESPHILHLHTSRAHALSPWLGRQAARTVVTRRMDYPLRGGFWSDLLYNRRVAAVVAISGEVERQLLAGGVRPQRIRVIPSGVEAPAGLPGSAGRAAARARFGLGEEFVIGVVAALERRKGHDVLLAALARLRDRHPPVRCLFCGDGSERESLERLAGDLGVAAAVHFLGEQPQVADLLAALDLFVMPSRHEGLGVAILEAMAMGLPVVASAVGGIPESVAAGRTGFLVSPEDPGSLAQAIAELADDPDRASRMGAEGRARVREHFSMEKMAEQYERLYEEVSSRS